MSVHRYTVVEPAVGTLGTHAFRVVQGTGVPVELNVTIEGEGGGGGAVDSVNGQTGVVVLDAADVGAATAAQGALADTAVQDATTDTLTNKTLDSFTNTVNADDLHIHVRNSSGALIAKGTPVYVSGYNVGQDLVEVAPADASNLATMPCLGLTETDIANNATGAVDRSGRISGLNTSGFTVGDRLYVSETTGALTATRPSAPAITQQIATVLRVHATLGVLDVGSNAALIPASEIAVGGVELATTAETTTGTDTERATHPAGVKAAIDAAIAGVLDSAPGALDTLNELAAALGDDANFASTVTTALAGKQPLDADLTALAAAGNSAVLAATTASFTTADETKLDGIAAGAEVNVQSDWNAGSGDAHILNKPTLGTAAAAATTDFATAAQGTLADSAVQPGDLATVATTGDYDDLSDKPTIPTHLRTIHTDANATLTLSASHLYGYLRLTDASPDLTVPDDADVTWPVGGWVEIFASGGAITFVEDTSVTINVAAGQSLIGEDAGSMFYLIKVAANTWDLAGRLAS